MDLVVPLMRAAGGGSIVNITGLSVIDGGQRRSVL
jgi:hypothetical protein